MSEQRLDDLVAELARSRPKLDDLTRARVAASLGEALRPAAAPRRRERLERPRRRRWIGGIAAAAVLAAVGAAYAWRGGVVTGIAAIRRDPAPSAEQPAVARIGGGHRERLLAPGAAPPNAAEPAADRVAIADPPRRAAEPPPAAQPPPSHAPEPRAEVAAIATPPAGAAPGPSRSAPPASPPAPRRPGRAVAARPPAPVPPPEPAAHSDAPAASTAASPTSTAARAADAPLPPAPPAVAVRADTAPVRDDASPAATAPPDARSAAADDDARIAARYAAAERKLVGAPAAARDELEALVGEFPRAPATAAALLDLAWLAVKSGDAPAARSALDRLAEHPAGAALAMSAAYLRCIVERERAALQACLTAFRSRFPDSPNDPDVLARLAVSLASAGDCRAARPLLVEYAQRYPRGSSAATLQMLRDRCGQ